jgi:hypothetical protein
VPDKGKQEFLVPDKAADEPEEGELPVDELKVLTGPCQQVPALQLLSNKPYKTKCFLLGNSVSGVLSVLKIRSGFLSK